MTCDWPVIYPGGAPCPALAGLSPGQQELYEQMAGDYLANWTGYGLCEVSLRPCRSECGPNLEWFWGNGPYPPGFATQNLTGVWKNVGCGSCGDSCGCGSVPSLRLPGPVEEVTSVLIDGAALDPTAYRVDSRALLVRLDGEAWPVCQDMSADPLAEVNTFQVDYRYGRAVPAGGQVAAGVLACELAKAAVGDSSCQLPRRVQTIARQGVTVSFLDSMDDLDKGRTGIWLIDSWVASVTNPPRPSTVRSPDIPYPRHRVTTWPAG